MFLENIDSHTLFIIGIAIAVLVIAKIIGKAVKLCVALVIVIIVLSLTGVFGSDGLFSYNTPDTYYCLNTGGYR